LAELLPVLLKAHRKIDPRKKIVLILNNARYHPEAEIKKLETASNSSHERGGFVRQFEIQFTSRTRQISTWLNIITVISSLH
jgi:hypothetical protein